MARPHDRKRLRSEEPSLQTDLTSRRKKQRVDNASKDDDPIKRPRSAVENLDSWQYPPEFWDRLSAVPLERGALEELDRRTCTRQSYPPSPIHSTQDLTAKARRELARFARHGGPDIRDLRGYPSTTSHRQPANIMSSSSRSRATKSTNPTTLALTSGTTTTKKSITPYNRGFEQHLTDHDIHPIYSSTEPDLEEVMAAIAVPRPSLSPSRFSDGAFKVFRGSNARAKDEDDVKADVIPTICGPRQANHHSALNTVFGNLEPLTDGTLAPANPDLYYGAYPKDLDRWIRDELAGQIIPSTMTDKPMAPNFFLEVKGPDGSAAVAARQARYDGAIGARAMHSLQNYSKLEPQYDGKAHTFSSTYHDGTLKLYTHHVTPPTTEGGWPEYHMSQLRSFGMTDTRQTFVEGATAFRNARDLAKSHRDTFIRAANVTASQPGMTASEAFHKDEQETPGHELPGSEDNTDYVTSRDADDALQQYIARTSCYALEDDEETVAVPHYLHEEDNSQGLSQGNGVPDLDDPSLASSFTSSLSTTKRPRQSHSPPSTPRGGQLCKNRKQSSLARRTPESWTPDTGSVQPGSSYHHWAETHGRKGKVYFTDTAGEEVETKLEDWAEETGDGVQSFSWRDSESDRAFGATELPKKAKKGRYQ